MRHTHPLPSMTFGSLSRFLLVLLVALTAVFAPTAASAAPSQLHLPHSRTLIDGETGGGPGVCGNSLEASNIEFLPVHRWIDQTGGFHTRLPGVSIANPAESFRSVNAGTQRSMIGMLMSLGNAATRMTVGVTDLGINFCPIDSAGGLTDHLVGKITRAILVSPLIGMVMGVGIIILLLRQLKGRSSAAELLKFMVTRAAAIAAIGLMGAGALQSTGGGLRGSSGDYRPGTFSPGWTVVQAQKVLGTLSSVPSSIVSELSEDIVSSRRSQDPDHCDSYIASMKNMYKYRNVTDGNGVFVSASASVPVIINDMWESTGLETWKQLQFGPSEAGASDNLGDRVACRLLEAWRDTQVTAEAGKGAVQDRAESIQRYGADSKGQGWPGALPADNLAWTPRSDEETDQSVVMWAACRHTGDSSWQVLAPWHEKTARGITGEDCAKAFGASRSDSAVSAFNVDKAGEVENRQVRRFLANLHGDENGAVPLTGALLYVASSLVQLVVFGSVAAATALAKLSLIIVGSMAIVQLLLYLFVGTSSQGLVKWGKSVLGLTAITFFLLLTYSLLAAITRIVIASGQVFMKDHAMASIWVGVSPLLAVAAIGMTAKRMGLQNPLRVAGVPMGGMLSATGASAIGNMAANWVGRKFESGRKSRAEDKLKKLDPKHDTGEDTLTGGGRQRTMRDEVLGRAGMNLTGKNAAELKHELDRVNEQIRERQGAFRDGMDAKQRQSIHEDLAALRQQKQKVHERLGSATGSVQRAATRDAVSAVRSVFMDPLSQTRARMDMFRTQWKANGARSALSSAGKSAVLYGGAKAVGAAHAVWNDPRQVLKRAGKTAVLGVGATVALGTGGLAAGGVMAAAAGGRAVAKRAKRNYAASRASVAAVAQDFALDAVAERERLEQAERDSAAALNSPRPHRPGDGEQPDTSAGKRTQ